MCNAAIKSRGSTLGLMAERLRADLALSLAGCWRQRATGSIAMIALRDEHASKQGYEVEDKLV